jgi:hypothetical protein
VTLLAAACGAPSNAADAGRLRAVVSPAIPPTAEEFVNPLRGQYENLLMPLFPQSSPAQRHLAQWPGSFDTSMRIAWRDLQPVDPRTLPPDAPVDRKYDFRAIDEALANAGARGMRLTLRVYAYNSCCDLVEPDGTNVALPDWLRTIPGASTTFAPTGRVPTQVVPNWNSPDYLAGFEELLAALGRRYDGDERLSIFEFSGYGDFSENHIAYLRDTLNSPGPAPQDSVRALGYFSQYRDQSITAPSISRLVGAHVAAFPRTQLVFTPQNPEIARQLLSERLIGRLSAPVGIRSDCLGVYEPLPAWAHEADSPYVRQDDSLVKALTQRLATAPVITEWCQLPDEAGARAYYEKGLRDVVAFHVSMTSSTNFPDRDAPAAMNPELFSLWSRANVFAGYRYSVEAVPGSESTSGESASVDVRWTNLGSAVATEKWVPSYRVVDRSGNTVRTLPASVDLAAILAEQPVDPGDPPVPASVTERLRIETSRLAPGSYTVSAAAAWQQHKPLASHVVDYPPMRLAREGRDGAGWYPIATFDLP